MPKNSLNNLAILLIDNNDSFTYNIAQSFQMLEQKIVVLNESQVILDDIIETKPLGIVLGPGPGHPQNARVSLEILQRYSQTMPMLGVCLGHQCIAEGFGGKVIRAQKPLHAKESVILHDQLGIFHGLQQGFRAIRYNSLIVNNVDLPNCLMVSAKSEEGEIMGLRHKKYPWIEGVQFHPDSVMSEFGLEIFKNFLVTCKNKQIYSGI